MTDRVQVEPPAFLHGLVRRLQVQDGDLLLVEVPAEWEWRFGEAERWAADLVSELREVHGWTVTAVVLPPGTRIGHFRSVKETPPG